MNKLFKTILGLFKKSKPIKKSYKKITLKDQILYNVDVEKINVNSLENCIVDFNKKLETIGVIYGELDHTSKLDITLHNVSHSIEKIKLDNNNNIIANIKTLSTPSGKILQNLINDGVKINFKPRMIGIRNKNNIFEVKEIHTFDVCI